MALVAWFVALRGAKHGRAVLARDPMLTSAARSRALMLSSAHPSAEVVELIATNPPLLCQVAVVSGGNELFVLSARHVSAGRSEHTVNALSHGEFLSHAR